MQATRSIKLAIVTNIPTPYRIPVYNLLNEENAVRLHVIYTAPTEPNRSWTLPPSSYSSTTLRSRVATWRGRYIHFSWGTTRVLRDFRPDAVVTTGFNPPQLAAFLWCYSHNVPHICQTDGSIRSETRLSMAHRLIRRLVASRTSAFIAASAQGALLQQSWGASENRILYSPLAIDNDKFRSENRNRTYDFIFSGQLTATKDPLFAIEVAVATSRRLGAILRMAIVGGGPLEAQVRARAAAVRHAVTVDVYGPTAQHHLPGLYGSSKMLLMPTRWDPWGLVINEAAAAGAVPLVSEAAGAAGELVIDGESGLVLPRQLGVWVDAAYGLLREDTNLCRYSERAVESVQGWTFARAADGIRSAALLAIQNA